MYLQPTENHWATDIEADNLLPDATTVWCVCMINVVTKEEKEFTDAEAFKVWRTDNPSAIFVGHNFISYDAPMLNRFWSAAIPVSKIVDTFVLSQLYNPTYKGGHSLEAWGVRLRYEKGKFNDFSHLSPEMLRYCRRDTRLTALLYRRLSDRMRAVGFTEAGCEIEHLAWNIIQNKQKRNGFPFDHKRALELYVSLRDREEELKNEIYQLWPPQLEIVKALFKARKKNGERTALFTRYSAQFPKVVEYGEGCGLADAYDYVAFNLGSPQQRVEKLLELGWKPVNKTKAGAPKVDEDALLDFAESSGTPEIKALAKWIVVNSRANMVGTWLNSFNRETGGIHGKLFIASTLRYRHNSPNTANIPAVRLKKVVTDGIEKEEIQYGEDGAWTYECRDLWTAGTSNDWSLVGIDGTGIQNRCLIHHLIKTVGEEAVADFKELSLRGDIHKRNIEVLGLAHKAASKKFYFTLMMGGGGARLAADQYQFGTKMTAREGEAKKKELIKSMPGFYELIEALEKDLEQTGRIRLCDGTPILVPSPHMVIPYLLQGDESRLMKQAMIYVDEIIRRNKWSKYVLKVADIHDEHQYRAHNDVMNEFVEAALPCFPRAGERFNYNITIEADYKVGKTWAETH